MTLLLVTTTAFLTYILGHARGYRKGTEDGIEFALWLQDATRALGPTTAPVDESKPWEGLPDAGRPA